MVKLKDVNTLKVDMDSADATREPDKSDLKRIEELAGLLVDQIEIVTDIEEKLEAAQKVQSRLELEDLPTLMQEVGLEDFTLKSGTKVEIKEDVKASISEANKSKAFAWLIEHGFGGLIKGNVVANFGKDDFKKAAKLATKLSSKYDDVEFKKSVHHSTLKSWVNEQREKGTKLPTKLFGIYPFSKAKVTLKRK